MVIGARDGSRASLPWTGSSTSDCGRKAEFQSLKTFSQASKNSTGAPAEAKSKIPFLVRAIENKVQAQGGRNVS
jgi:hypothetical protein